MAAKMFELLSPRSLSTGDESELSEVVDVGPYRFLSVAFRIIGASTTGTVSLMHAAVKDPDAFTPLGTAVSLTSGGVIDATHEYPLRYLGWEVTGAISGSPIVSIHVLARE